MSVTLCGFLKIGNALQILKCLQSSQERNQHLLATAQPLRHKGPAQTWLARTANVIPNLHRHRRQRPSPCHICKRAQLCSRSFAELAWNNSSPHKARRSTARDGVKSNIFAPQIYWSILYHHTRISPRSKVLDGAHLYLTCSVHFPVVMPLLPLLYCWAIRYILFIMCCVNTFLKMQD
jgi:hypothetical protein